VGLEYRTLLEREEERGHREKKMKEREKIERGGLSPLRQPKLRMPGKVLGRE